MDLKARGQTAMEFLMTYGWAILVMLVVIAVLFYLGVFSPETVSPKACVLEAGFSCYGYKISAGGALELQLVQTKGHTLYIEQLACSDEETLSHGYSVPDARIFSGEKAALSTTCYKSDGNTPAVGEFYKGVIYMIYMDEDTNIRHKMKGEISYRVEE